MTKDSRNWLYLPLLGLCVQANADYRSDIAYTRLKDELIASGIAVPNGDGVKISQVEASSSSTTAIFAPDPNATALVGKSFAYPGLTSCATLPCLPSEYSSHATGVANTFFGNTVSMAKGINDIHSYEVNQWISSLYSLGTYSTTTTDRRVANHSWVSTGIGNSDAAILRIVDRQVDRNEYIQVAATSGRLLSNAYNVIAVGLTSSTANNSSAAIDTSYLQGRAVTDLVAPAVSLSTATPIVAAATALLVQIGHQQTGLSLAFSNISGVGTIYNAERSETIKAVLMAGADRETNNSSGYGNINGYRSADRQTANGLDSRYGAGQLNVDNSYYILTAGEQNSQEDGGANTGQIGDAGFDYDPSFGGLNGSNSTASYVFTASSNESIKASLVWNVSVSNNSALTTTIHHLGLSLIDVTDGGSIKANSESLIDNTQNIAWDNLIAGHQYRLSVDSLEASNFKADYAVAWQRRPHIDTDTDADGVPDFLDNCTLVANANQRDTDGDDYGNICDPDFNQNNVVDPLDLNTFKAKLGQVSPHQDLNGNGIVDPLDLNILKTYLGKAPGPSGLHP
ncbi:MAG: thrombospondin type 3 repeat-containing protein [Methylomonas sp.]|nr:thrombospondin type 3 repeat-containing protein [Methylomonas sp.]